MGKNETKSIEELFSLALAVEADRRRSFLVEACAGDTELLREVESLLSAHEQAGAFLEKSLDAEAISVMINRADEISPRLQPGDRFAKYKIVRLIARAGMGEVYLAQDTELGFREIALKIVRLELDGDRERLQQFKREAEIIATLRHKNIITIHTVGTEAGAVYLDTEYVHGENLRARLNGHALPLLEVIGIVDGVASALREAHKKRIAHADIKPENIMIQADGNIKVLDFGLATGFKFGAEPISSADSTWEMEPAPRGIVGGTFRYMSPEQVRGEALDLQTDIFSLGIVIYEMVAGCRPFDGRDPGDVLQSILASTPAPLRDHVADVPFELQSIVSKALSKDKAGRYSSISEFQADWSRLKSYLRSGYGRPQMIHDVDDFFRQLKPALLAKDSTKGRARRRPRNDLFLVLHATGVPRPAVTGILRRARAEGVPVLCPTEHSMFYEYAEALRKLIPSAQCVVYLCSSPSESIEKGWAGFARFLAVRCKKPFHAIYLDAD